MRRTGLIIGLCLWLGLGTAFPAAAARGEKVCWVATWASSQQIPEPRNALPPEDLTDATLRQIVRTTIGGNAIRIRVSNLFGTAPLRVQSVQVARSTNPASSAIDPASRREVSFAGNRSITIPAGAEYLSDPVDLAVPALTHLAISLYLPEAPAQQTSHPGSRATSYFVHGDHSGDADLPGAKTIDHWYQLTRIDVPAGPGTAALVTIGDSITDGSGTKPNTDTRWPDYLVRRLQADPRTRSLAVLNHGMGGNRVLLDGLGPNLLARFERDVLMQPGVRFFILLEGVNDLGTLTRDAPVGEAEHQALVANIIAAYRQMVARARERGVMAIGATILPYGGSAYYHPDARNEADRQAINSWIRAPGNFDSVIDFDAAMRDPADPTRMRAEYDSSDGLHPSIVGYEAMAKLVPASLFTGASKRKGCPG